MRDQSHLFCILSLVSPLRDSWILVLLKIILYTGVRISSGRRVRKELGGGVPEFGVLVSVAALPFPLTIPEACIIKCVLADSVGKGWYYGEGVDSTITKKAKWKPAFIEYSTG